MIAMQAGVALRVLDRDPSGARSALEGIRALSRDALAGLRAEVEALQHGVALGGRANGSGAPRRPGSGLADLPALAARMRAAGLPVTLEAPSSVEAPLAVDLAAYRIVQESLTNVLRHAGPRASAWVTLRVPGDHLQISVRDDGDQDRAGIGAEAGPGHGIAGMREQAASVGGTLRAGAVTAGGFLVEAVLTMSTQDSTR